MLCWIELSDGQLCFPFVQLMLSGYDDRGGGG